MRALLIVGLLCTVLRAQALDEVLPVSDFATGPGADGWSSVPPGFGTAILLSPGAWALSVRVERQRFVGLRDGQHDLSTSEALLSFPEPPRDLTVDATRIEALFGLDEDTTFRAELPWLRKRLSSVTDLGGHFDTTTEGVGDLEAGLNLRGPEWDEDRIVLHAGLSLPTGSVHEKSGLPGPSSTGLSLPLSATAGYAEQPGSGTVNLLPKVAWVSEGVDWDWGAQLALVQPLGRNSQGWSRGNERSLSGWGIRKLGGDTSASLRLTARQVGNVHGSASIQPFVSPVQAPDMQAGDRIEAAVGLRTGRFVIEVGAPLYESLDGPQLSLNWFATAGWQFAF